MNHGPVVVMGVAGAGKSTIGAALAERLGVGFIDADHLHPRSNIDKMSSGVPLTDEDRWPWLDDVGLRLQIAPPAGLVVACSALRRVYRDRLRAAAPALRFVLLSADRDILEHRLRERSGHFMPGALLDSQLATLEVLGPDEAGVIVDVAVPETVVVETALEELNNLGGGLE